MQSETFNQVNKKPTLEEFKLEAFDLRQKGNEENSSSLAADASTCSSLDIKELEAATVDRVIEMAWEDRTPFSVIEKQFGLKEKDVIAVMRRYMKRSSFKMWRRRVAGRRTKHKKKREFEVGRFRSSNQKNY